MSCSDIVHITDVDLLGVHIVFVSMLSSTIGLRIFYCNQHLLKLCETCKI